jgi:beta-lactamase regulating signal transducer with metallopeptidase domain
MTALIDLGIRALVLLSLGWIGTALLRRRSASVRASIWTAALAAVLLLPAVSMFGPAWRIPVLAGSETAPLAPKPTPASSANEGATDAVGLSNGALNPTLETPDSPGTIAAVTDPSRGLDWASIALATLGLVTCVLLIRIGAGYRRMQHITNRAVEADAIWSTLADEVRRELGIVRKVPVRVTDDTNVPAVTGLSNPVLLLPIETDEWPLDVRRAVVLHELAHVARRDSLGQLIGQIACAVYWFVPLTWYGARRAAAFRERASDDVVIQAGVRPSSYAESLIALARSSSQAMQSPATMAIAESRIRERVTAILTPSARRERLTWRSATGMLVLMLGTTAIVGAIEPAARASAIGDRTLAPVSVQTPSVFELAAPSLANKQVQSTRPATAAPKASAPVAQGDRICGGKGLDSSSSSIHESDNERRWTVKLSGDSCSVDVRAEGKFEFNADFTDIARLDPNGFFRVDVTDRGVRRQLEIESKTGTLTRTWRVDGRERPYDAEARAWFAAFLIELDRRTAIGVDIRLPVLVRQGGVDAVLNETGLMLSDHARSQYYLKLQAATKVTPAETIRLLKQAGSLTSSDHYLSEVVRVYGTNVQDAAIRQALVDLVEHMTSDHYQATSVETILGNRAPGPAEMDVLVRLVPKMSSDHYKTQVLLKVLKAPSLSASHRFTVATVAGSIASDTYAAEVLETLARMGLGDDAVRRAFFEAASKVESDHYRGAVLTAVLDGRSVTERDLLDVVASAKGIGSDHYKAGVLEDVARHQAATDRVRTAVLDASSGLSRTYAEQVRRAAGR